MRRLLPAVVAGCVLGSAAVSAQTSDRPFRGLFGAASESRSQGLDLTVTAVQAYDDNLLAENGSITPSAPAVGGFFNSFEYGSRYAWSRRSFRLAATAASVWKYYQDSGRVQTGSHSGGVGLSVQLARRATLSLNQNAAYTPSYLFGLFPVLTPDTLGQAQPIAADYAVEDLSSVSYVSDASVTLRPAARQSLTFSGDYAFTDFRGVIGTRGDLNSYGLRTQFSRDVYRRTAWRTGYRYRAGEFGAWGLGAGLSTEHSVDFGIEHTHVISASRQAHVDASFGVASMNIPAAHLGGADRGTLNRLYGDASASLQFGRSWQARASYRRGVEYIPSLSDPVIADGFTLALQGFLSRRIDVVLAGGYVDGESAVYSASHFGTWTAKVKTRFALARSAALSLEYLYYVYDFSSAAGLLTGGMPTTMERNGIRLGLTLWMPAFNR